MSNINFQNARTNLFQTPQFVENVGPRSQKQMGPRHLLVVSDFDHTLTRNDCGEQVARAVGIDGKSFYEAAATIGATQPQVERGGEFAAMVLEHPKFTNLSRKTLVASANQVRLKDNVGAMYSAMNAGKDDWRASFFVVSAGPQETVRAALATQHIPENNVIGTRFSYAPDSDIVTGLVHVSAGAGKVEIIQDLQKLLGVEGPELVYFGDGSSDVAAMQYVQAQGGFNVAVEDHPALRPYRSVLLAKSDDAMDFLKPIVARSQDNKARI